MEGELGWIACRAGQLIPYLAQKKTRDGGGGGPGITKGAVTTVHLQM